MKVLINGVWFDSEKTPIQIQLSKSDKKNIANMHSDKFNYICFPSKIPWEEVDKILKTKQKSFFDKIMLCVLLLILLMLFC